MCSEKSERFGMRHATDECLIENFSELAPKKTNPRNIKRQNVAFLKADRDPVNVYREGLPVIWCGKRLEY
jgi:hypothetical protein